MFKLVVLSALLAIAAAAPPVTTYARSGNTVHATSISAPDEYGNPGMVQSHASSGDTLHDSSVGSPGVYGGASFVKSHADSGGNVHDSYSSSPAMQYSNNNGYSSSDFFNGRK